MNQNPLFQLFKVLAVVLLAALSYVALCIVSPDLAVALFALAVITAPWWYGAVRRGGR